MTPALLTLLSSHALAGGIDIDVGGVGSWGEIGDSGNVVLSVDLNAALGASGVVIVDGIGWLVDIDTVGDSWLSEAHVSLGDSAGVAFVDLVPGPTDFMPGSMTYDSGGVMDLVGLDLAFELADGILRLEFYETFDDDSADFDALWGGVITVSASGTPIPAPAALWLLGSGVFWLFAFAARRG